MKTVTSFFFSLAGALLIVIASAAIAAAFPPNTCVGSNATMGGSCTPLTNPPNGPDNGNTAVGANALQDTGFGSSNTGVGAGALEHGNDFFNTAVGAAAIGGGSGGSNTAVGFSALGNVPHNANTAVGYFALGSSTGNSNIGIGYNAGLNLTTGDNNIHIGNDGFAGDAATIRIGTQGTQTNTHIAGIFGSTATKKACQVVVQSNGKLACMASSARYKHDIRDMGNASDKLMRLRPVMFRYNDDTAGTAEYGLIAEEVEKVYPELVIDGIDGRPQTVAYQELPAMMLNEVQKERRHLAQKDAEIAAMRRQLEALQKKNREIDALAKRLDALERQARATRPERLAAALR